MAIPVDLSIRDLETLHAGCITLIMAKEKLTSRLREADLKLAPWDREFECEEAAGAANVEVLRQRLRDTLTATKVGENPVSAAFTVREFEFLCDAAIKRMAELGNRLRRKPRRPPTDVDERISANTETEYDHALELYQRLDRVLSDAKRATAITLTISTEEK